MPQLAPTDSEESNCPSISPMLNETACAWAQKPSATAGGSALVDPIGTLLFEAGREEGQFTVELDLDQLVAARKDYRYLDDQRLKLPGEVIERTDGTRELLIPQM